MRITKNSQIWEVVYILSDYGSDGLVYMLSDNVYFVTNVNGSNGFVVSQLSHQESRMLLEIADIYSLELTN